MATLNFRPCNNIKVMLLSTLTQETMQTKNIDILGGSDLSHSLTGSNTMQDLFAISLLKSSLSGMQVARIFRPVITQPFALWMTCHLWNATELIQWDASLSARNHLPNYAQSCVFCRMQTRENHKPMVALTGVGHLQLCNIKLKENSTLYSNDKINFIGNQNKRGLLFKASETNRCSSSWKFSNTGSGRGIGDGH